MKPDRVLRALAALAGHPEPTGVLDLGIELGEPAPSLHRTLQRLIEYELVVQNPATKRYQLGPAVLVLADAYRRQSTLVSIAQPVLDELGSSLDETVFLCQLIEDAAVVVATAESRRTFQYFMRLGHRMPFHAAASARAILAFQDPAQIDCLLDREGSDRYTDRTMIEIEELKAELDRVRRRGYAVCDQEIEVGVKALAVPVRDASGHVIASIAVVAPRERLVRSPRHRPIQSLQSAAREVSKGLGFRTHSRRLDS
jgi:IclR family acetate operon transcriptional repressor